MNKIPNLKFKSYQDYILHIDSSYAECITKDKNKIEDLIKDNKATIDEIKTERNFYGFTDCRIICFTSEEKRKQYYRQ
jgi:hypothetical protein